MVLIGYSMINVILFSKDDDYDEDIDIIKLKEILKEKVIEK